MGLRLRSSPPDSNKIRAAMEMDGFHMPFTGEAKERWKKLNDYPAAKDPLAMFNSGSERTNKTFYKTAMGLRL